LSLWLLVSFYDENVLVVAFHKVVLAPETLYLIDVSCHFLVVYAIGADIFLKLSLLLYQKGVLTAQPVVGHKTVVVYYDEKQNEY
jgi:hypothetical protein